MPILSAKANPGYHSNDKIGNEGQHEGASDVNRSDSYTMTTLTTPGLTPSIGVGDVSSTILSSINNQANTALNLAQTQSESFNNQKQMMQLGIPG